MDLSLQIIVNEQGDTHNLDLGDATSVGRSSDNRIQISEPYISTKHAFISRSPSGLYFIEDCGSKNGTYLNDQPVEGSTQINEGDIIRFGLAACKVVLSESSDQAVTPTGPAATAAGLAVAGAAATAAAVSSQLPGDLSLAPSATDSSDAADSDYAPIISDDSPVSWVWSPEYKPGILTSYPFTVKPGSKKKPTKSARKTYFASQKKKPGYDPFATAEA